MIVAVCGKGGVGKTTVTALIARALVDGDRGRTLLVDADPTGGLTMALGIPVARTLNDVRKETIAAVKKRSADTADLAAAVDYRLLEAIAEHGPLALLSVGRPEEDGCYCNLNALLREAIEPLAARFDRTVIDAEAGIEQVNRRVMRAVDVLLLVSDPSARGVRVAEAIANVAADAVHPARVGLVVNRVQFDADLDAVRGRTTLDIFGAIPEDPDVRRFDVADRSILDLPDRPAAAAVRAILDRLG